MEKYHQIRLQMSADVERLLQTRRILQEEVQGTIDHAERTGEKFVDLSAGRSLASWRQGRVTYWVEYSRAGDAYLIHTAYSHRMEMKRGTGS